MVIDSGLREKIALQLFTSNGAMPSAFKAMPGIHRVAWLTKADRLIEEIRRHDSGAARSHTPSHG